MDYLHNNAELTIGFKIKLMGEGFPPEFQVGDILNLLNLVPDKGNFVLLKLHGKYEIERFDDHTRGRYLNNVLGTIDSITRSVGEFELLLGEEPDKEVVPALCSGCDRVEVLEMNGRVDAYCWTKEGIKRVPKKLGRCVCGHRKIKNNRTWEGQ